MTAPLSPVQVLDAIEKLAMAPLGISDAKQALDVWFERRRNIADLAADLRLRLEAEARS